jgi:Protein of unknown function (DUF3072)
VCKFTWFAFCTIIKKNIMTNNIDEQDDNKTQSQVPQPDPAISSGAGSNVEKDPDDWVTGAEPLTGAQKSYLKTLSDQAGEPFNENLSKAEASKRIEELQQKTGRGVVDKD